MAAAGGDMRGLLSQVFAAYTKDTTKKVRILDLYLAAVLLTGIVQFVYCALVGTFPFNSFLAGFISTVGMFVLTVSLRLQVTSPEFAKRLPQRAYADYVFCCLVLFLVVFNFMG